MTAAEFIASVEDYYGEYPRPAMKTTCYSWAKEHEFTLEKLYPALLKDFSGEFKTVPDVAVFERIANDIGERGAWGGYVGNWRSLNPNKKQESQLGIEWRPGVGWQVSGKGSGRELPEPSDGHASPDSETA